LADDPQDLAGGGLLLQPLLQLPEEARVLDRDDDVARRVPSVLAAIGLSAVDVLGLATARGAAGADELAGQPQRVGSRDVAPAKAPGAGAAPRPRPGGVELGGRRRRSVLARLTARRVR